MGAMTRTSLIHAFSSEAEIEAHKHKLRTPSCAIFFIWAVCFSAFAREQNNTHTHAEAMMQSLRTIGAVSKVIQLCNWHVSVHTFIPIGWVTKPFDEPNL